ncbi:MAG: glycoside hydrolase [Clostridia bacterium]|nr:glycoside hydrolase [Clostridia bacterium]
MGVLYVPGEGYTYGEKTEKLVEENVFIGAARDTREVPTYDGSKDVLPYPFVDGREDFKECYDKAWQIAFSNLRTPTEASGFCSRFIDTAFNGFLFMWDSSFIVMFGKYGARAFDFQATLDNFYARQHPDGFICREICEAEGGDQFFRHDPSSTGPNILPWAEWLYYENFGDVERIKQVFPPLLAYHRWLREHRTWRDGSYWTTGWGCGMDNSPRIERGRDPEFSHGHMVWIDACCQMILSGKILGKMASLIGREDDAKDVVAEAKYLSDYVNRNMWDEKTGFYYDLRREGLSGVKTLASYWALVAGIVPEERVERFVSHLLNKDEFMRPHAPATLSADDPDYHPFGGYWRGSVWAPTSYMVLKGLDLAGMTDAAQKIAENHYSAVLKVYKDTGTFWENYAPDKIERGESGMTDFVGWTGLPPIAVYLEYIIGIKPDGKDHSIEWNVTRLERHGVLRYPLGADCDLDLICEARENGNERPIVKAISKRGAPVRIKVKWHGGEYETTSVSIEAK